MNYLTNYYKNLSENLLRRVTLLENYLNEMQSQIAAGTPEIVVPEMDAETAVAPPSGSPSQTQNSPGAPTDPGDTPRRREGESDKQYQLRYEEWLKAKKRWEVYQKFREDIEKNGHKVFSYPQRMPSERVGDERRAIPPAKPGDIYISQNGQVYRVNGQGIWVLV